MRGSGGSACLVHFCELRRTERRTDYILRVDTRANTETLFALNTKPRYPRTKVSSRPTHKTRRHTTPGPNRKQINTLAVPSRLMREGLRLHLLDCVASGHGNQRIRVASERVAMRRSAFQCAGCVCILLYIVICYQYRGVERENPRCE